MTKMNSLFHQTSLGKTFKEKPIWIMRQAGRYLPEYKAIRKDFKDFISFCLTPDAVHEVTLQPIKRFDFDAAIIFSDILIIPYLLEQDVIFEEGYGPKLSQIPENMFEKTINWGKVSNVYKAIEMVRKSLSSEKSLIGFCGTPWTLMSYMIFQKKIGNGEGLKKAAKEYSEKDKLLNLLIDVVAQHAMNQISAGCDVIQFFDSWAGLCDNREEFLINPIKAIFEKVWSVYPNTPLIYYGRGVSEIYTNLKDLKGNILFGVDEDASLKGLKSLKKPLQGNLSPKTIIDGGKNLDEAVDVIMGDMKGFPHIFNLGHGIKPETPIQNVEHLIKKIRSY